MKSATALAAALALALTLTACINDPRPLPEGSPEPTEAEAAAVTAPPSDAPTAEPTAAPTAAPAPTFAPYSTATGKLTDGPFLPEGAEFLVIKGESDLYYVYNSEGELIDTFHAVDEESMYCRDGIYGPKGVICGRMISTGEQIGDLNYLGDIIFTTQGWYSESGDHYEYGTYVKNVYNSELELMCGFDEHEAELGHIGGIIHIDGKLLVLDREFDWEHDRIVYNSEPKLYSEQGEYLGTLDVSPFDIICGVLGGKYLVCRDSGSSMEDAGYTAPIFTLFTLDGSTVMKNVGIILSSGYAADDEIWYGALYGAEYVVNSSAEAFDGGLEPAGLPEDPWIIYGELARPYRVYDGEDFRYTAGSVYTGVKDAEGNWLFRIYNPGNASDSDNSEGDRFWQVYGKSSDLQYYWWD